MSRVRLGLLGKDRRTGYIERLGKGVGSAGGLRPFTLSCLVNGPLDISLDRYFIFCHFVYVISKY